MSGVRLPPAADLAADLASWLSTRPPRTVAGGRRAAVLLVLFDQDARPHTLLTKRADHLAVHGGQVSLPGGRFEDHDASLWDTALRETEEEVGVPRGEVQLVGRLDDVETMATSFVVTPFVGLLAGPPSTRPDTREVARIIEAPLDELIAADAKLPPSPSVATLRYPLFGEDIWGATARILTAFIAELHGAASARRREAERPRR